MGQIVGGFATSHVMFDRTGVEPQADRILGSFRAMRQRLAALRPDVVVMVSSEHGPTMPPLGPQPSLAIGRGERLRTFGDLGLPTVEVPGHPAFAADLLAAGRQAGYELAPIEDFVADHGIAFPLLMLMPEHATPVVPLIVNINIPEVVPTADRAYGLGLLIRQAAAARPAGERVVVVGAGGLSHWVGVPEMGRVNESFDRHCLDLLQSGKASELRALSPAELLDQAGNGGQELLCWLVAAGAAGDCGGEVLHYEPMPQWLTGQAAMAFSAADA